MTASLTRKDAPQPDMKSTTWSPLLRVPSFLALFGAGYFLSGFLPVISAKSNLRLLAWVGAEAGAGNFEGVGHSDFAFALACSIVSVAFALAFAMAFTHVLAVRLSLRQARRELGPGSTKAFQEGFDRVNQRLGRHPLIGHAWDEFAKGCLRDHAIVRTARPSAFFNPSVARERLPGLKLMPTIPGYFVGLGLLLTFIGLVIALSRAAGGVAGSPENMTQALRDLLDAATFKFSTSIAGLFASLALAMVFKIYTMAVEGGFDAFCRAVEQRTTFKTAQGTLVDLAEASREQLQQLKEINDVQFFDRLGQTLGPALAGAVERAVAPLNEKLEATVGQLENSSRSGVESLLGKFSETLHASAGTELREISAVLKETREAFGAVRGDLSGSGEEFARRMGEATDTMSRLIAEASSQFAANNEASRETVRAVLDALDSSAQATRERLDRDVADAGRNASTAMRAGLEEVLSQVGAQMAAFQGTVSSLQNRVAEDLEAASARSREAAEAASDAAGRAARETADAIRVGLADTVAQLRQDVDRLAGALQIAQASFEAQSRATRETVEQTNVAAVSFGKVAGDVGRASGPLLTAAERIAGSTESLAESARGASESLRVAQEASRALAAQLEAGGRQIEAAWRSHEERFGTADQAMAAAVASLADGTARQQQLLTEFVGKVDEGCGTAIGRLAALVGSIEENTAEIGEAFEGFLVRMPRQEMAAA